MEDLDEDLEELEDRMDDLDDLDELEDDFDDEDEDFEYGEVDARNVARKSALTRPSWTVKTGGSRLPRM